jgi:hypothetical protein
MITKVLTQVADLKPHSTLSAIMTVAQGGWSYPASRWRPHTLWSHGPHPTPYDNTQDSPTVALAVQRQ